MRLSADERVVAVFRPRARALVWPTVLLFVVVALACYFAAQLTAPAQTWTIGIGAALAAVLLWGVPFVRWLATRHILTTRRVLSRAGLDRRRRSELELEPGMLVTVERTAWQRLCGCGDVVVALDGATVLVIGDAPSAHLVATTLGDLARASDQPPA